MIFRFILLLLSGLLLLGCGPEPAANTIREPRKQPYGAGSGLPDPVTYHDKVLGALVGSAIGDAMGASTEMWHRDDIRARYGYITGLTAAVREQSPEGTWEHNLGPGATTDDTRWKALMVNYFSETDGKPGPLAFAEFISGYYRSVAGELADPQNLTNPDSLAPGLEKVDWIREWARVALAYSQDPTTYSRALHRFYGGEMACAGMLYGPMFGLISQTPEEAYSQAYEHALFDIGYARDITGLVSAMTRMALQTNQMDSILDTSIFVDPLRYQDSRLVGRLALNRAEETRRQVRAARQDSMSHESVPIAQIHMPPGGYPGTSAEWQAQEKIYSYLQAEQEAIPFHAGEIWQILVAGLEFGQGDFLQTMQFIVNYGRDNDTVAAVAGMILGAKLGYSGLPQDLREEVLQANKEWIGIDLEKLAEALSLPEKHDNQP